jgi:hypothetical protein
MTNLEIVISLLPKMFSVADQSAGDSLFERLEDICQQAAVGFTQKQVNVLGHEHISKNPQFEIAAYAFERNFEGTSAGVCTQQWAAMIAAEGHEMGLASLLKAHESPRHGENLLASVTSGL